MTATPEQIRAGLHQVSAAAQGEVQAATEAAQTPSDLRAVLFAAAPLVAAEYAVAGAALGAEWYEDIRDAAAALGQVTTRFVPRLVVPDRTEQVKATVASLTTDLRDQPSAKVIDLVEFRQRIVDDVNAAIELEIANAQRETVTSNVAEDPDAVGWQRFARPEACKFCLMLAARGAVYTAATARFAAHGAVMADGRKGGNCMCVAGPAFGVPDDEASPMQYLASRRKRSAKQRAQVREYLNENFPDAPG